MIRSTACAGVLLSAALLLAQPAPPVPGYDEPLRPEVHFTPPRNFMNDPNGLVFYQGEYHLFYQHNPFGERWGHMSWGHAVSPDMLHWRNLPVAIPESDGVMIFSGSAVVDRDNSSGLCVAHGGDRSCLVAIYTGHGHNRQTQNLAFSNDRGRTWTKYAGNPVVDLGLENFRDPKVFWHAQTGRWIMVTVLADQHKVRFFGSPDLRHWMALSDFGPEGATGGVWECPDLFELPVAGRGESRWVLDVDINPGGVAGGSGGQYFVGRFDGTRFVNDNPPGTVLWADYGKDFYATTSYSDLPPSDGRRIWMGWISNWQYANDEPTVTWRGAQSVPRVLGLRPLPDGIRLVQAPIREFDSLRATHDATAVGAGATLPPSADILFEVHPGGGGSSGIRFSNARGEEATVEVDASGTSVAIDRRRSRQAAFSADYPGRHRGPARWKDGRVAVRVVFDRSVIEVFANDGETTLTDRVYPLDPFDRIEPFGKGLGPGTRLWALTSVWHPAPHAAIR
jgi:fructan beta-fructosidase